MSWVDELEAMHGCMVPPPPRRALKYEDHHYEVEDHETLLTTDGRAPLGSGCYQAVPLPRDE